MPSEVGFTLVYMPLWPTFGDYYPSLQRYEIGFPDSTYCFGKDSGLIIHVHQVGEFFFVRYVLAFVCALCQTLMWRVICRTLNPRIGLFFILALVFSPGNFHASTAYLPSSFAMYMAMVGAAAFMNWSGGLKTSQGMFWFAVGGVFGWPFAAALCAPFLLEEGLFAVLSDKERFFEAALRIFRGIVAAGILVVCAVLSLLISCDIVH